MQYSIESTQTIFGDERDHRLRLAFEAIWNFPAKKTLDEQELLESNETRSTALGTSFNEAEQRAMETEVDEVPSSV